MKSRSRGPNADGHVQRASEVTWSTHQLLQVVEQSKTLFVGDGGEGVVRVDLLQAGHQVGQRVVGSKGLHLKGHTDRLVGLQFQEHRGTRISNVLQSILKTLRALQTPRFRLRFSPNPAGPSSLPWL